MQSVLNTIEKYSLINKGDIVGCAVSGGSDSMCLLHFLMGLAEKYDFKIVVLNVEHGIRGQNSKNDTQFVKDFCKTNDIECICKSVDVPSYAKSSGKSFEDAARELRYDFFKQMINDGVCNTVATAHHKSDNVESVLLHIFRGSGLKGLGGIKEKSINNYIRPLINTSKREILQYLKENNVNYITDETNQDNNYRRNYLRNKVMPLLVQEFDGVEDNILRLSSIARQEDELLDSLAKVYIKKLDNGIKIDISTDKVLLMRAVSIACKMLGANRDISYINILDASNLITLQTGKSINLSCGITAHREHDGIFLERKNFKANKTLSIADKNLSNSDKNKRNVVENLNITEKNLSTVVETLSDTEENISIDKLKAEFYLPENIFTEFSTNFGDFDIKFTLISYENFVKSGYKFKLPFTDGEIPSSGRLFCDADKLIAQKAYIRSRKSSDLFKKINSGTKLVSDYFTDKKIYKRVRDEIPLICNKSEVLAILPFETAETIKIDNDTKKIYIIDFNKRGNFI